MVSSDSLSLAGTLPFQVGAILRATDKEGSTEISSGTITIEFTANNIIRNRLESTEEFRPPTGKMVDPEKTRHM